MIRITAVIGLALACALHADPPPLDALFPAGAARGTTNGVTAAGKFASWPLKAWISGDGVAISVETNKGKLSVVVSPDAAPGPRLVRLYDDGGTSEPRMFVVGAGRESPEVEPNNRFDQAQAVTNLPVTFNGRLDKSGDVDSFALKVRAGEWIVAQADCYTLLSKVDAVLRIVTTTGRQLAWNHDFTSLDPRLTWQAASNETVVVQFFGFAYPPGSEVALTGGEGAVYRLHLAVTNSAPVLCESPTESEPNNTFTNAGPMELPAAVTGMIDSPVDEDRFRFTVEKDSIIEARIDSASLGSPLDAWLKVEDLAGAQLARSDDAEGSPDPRLEWKAPTNGTFIVAIGSVTHRGGPDSCYKLSVRKAEPDFRAVLSQSSVVMKALSTNELKLTVKRLHGFTNELRSAFDTLPPGVTSLTTNLVAKDSGEITIRLAAAADAPTFRGPLRLYMICDAPPIKRAVPFELTTPGETGYSHLLVEQSEDLWLTVFPLPPPPAKSAPSSE